MKTISIIVPVYNVADYLDKCVSTIYSQLTDDIEVILVDDGSTDGRSPELCDAWATRDSRISVIHKKNGGLSDARNAGLRQASGQYIFFIDSDDYIADNALQIIKHYIHLNNNEELLVFNYRIVDENGKVSNCSDFQPGITDISDIDAKIGFIAGKFLRYRIGWEAWSRIFRKDIIDKYNLSFYNNKKIFAEDVYFSLCYMAHIKSIRVIPNALYNYLKRSDSIMRIDGRLNNLSKFSLLSQQVYNHYIMNDDCKKLVNCYPVINAQILFIEIPKAMEVEKYGLKGLCNEFKTGLPNYDFQKGMLKRFIRYATYIKNDLNDWQLHNEINTIKYLYDGDYFKLRIRNRVFSEKKKYDAKIDKLKKINEYKRFGRNNKKIYIIGTEDYGNLGDHKIAEAINHYLKNNCSDYAVKEITGSKYFSEKVYLERFIHKDDILVLTGGGNLGDVYLGPENIRCDVINTWKANKKIVFPQTIFFKETEAFNRSKDIYTKENNVVLFTREETSYKLAKNNYDCKVFLVPDIVLYEIEEKEEERTDTILLCLRSDIEKKLSMHDEEIIVDTARSHSTNIKFIDTQLDHNISKEVRAEEIERIMQLFRYSKLVITDRLHGMIFAAITGTPCIALNNYNQKISGSYEWMKNNSYVHLASTLDETLTLIEKMANQKKEYHYSNEELRPYFDLIAKIIKD